METFTLKETSEITMEKEKRIQYWILMGVFEPFQPSSGTGTPRRFSFENLFQISIASALSCTSMSVGIVKNIIRQLGSEYPDVFSETLESTVPLLVAQLVPRGSATYLIQYEERDSYLDDLLPKSLPLLLVDLRAMKSELLKRISGSA